VLDVRAVRDRPFEPVSHLRHRVEPTTRDTAGRPSLSGGESPAERMSAPAATNNDFLSVRAVLRVVLVVVAVVLALYLMYRLRKPLTWIFIAGFLAVALAGPVDLLSRRMRRGIAIALVYLCVILTPFLLIGLLLPPIVTQANNLVQNLPDYAKQVTDFVNSNHRLRQLQQDYDITGKLEQQATKLPAKIGDAAGVLTNIGTGIINSIFAAVTILVLSLFMMSSGKRFLDAYAARYPPDRERWLQMLYSRIGNAIGNYVAGALVQATIAGVASWIVLLILNVPYALPLAVIIFLLDLIPLVGATLGAVIIGVVTLFSDFPIDTIVWSIFAIVYQQVENNVIQPRIQAKAVQLDPLIVLVSVLFGSQLLGVLGALLAIPVAASIQITIREFTALRRADPVDAPATPGPAASSAGP
jgi:predicted PurR-regulated permease PerM